ncbi:hypothetical protein RCH14_003021 [Massilia sp. MP_M2]|uniref:hypothetical protein n=1 Tax=Massilia sp. MP_M2 TaxID=3071713 RepID=UPI00319DEA6D
MTMHRRRLLCRLGCVAALVVLAGCASSTATRIGTAATVPLADLNVAQEDIPSVLLTARQNPYQVPASQNCVAISLEIRELDEVLGADLDAPMSPVDPSLVHRVSSLVQEQAVGALQRTAEGLIPFRGWVRKLSGAERHSKQVAACIAAGSVRRAFLKGFAASANCAWLHAVETMATR